MAIGAVGVVCLIGTSSPTLAQAPGSDRPFRGLFGRGSQGSGGQSLDVSATLVEAYDDNLLAEVGTISPGAATLSGAYTMLQTAATYSWATRNVQLGMNGASAFRSYGGLDEVRSISHAAGVGLSATLPGRTSLAVNQNAAYSPSYLVGLFPSVSEPHLGDVRPTAPDYAANDLASYSYSSTATLTHRLTRRGSFTTGAEYTFTDFLSENNGRRDGSSYGARAEFSRSVGRHTSFRTAYRYRTGDFGSSIAGKNTEHSINFGVDHAWVLSATRGAEFSFALGASAADAPAEQSLTEPVLGQLYRLTADAGVGYQFSRTGQVRAAYRRGVEYIVELTEPIFIDAVNASLSGSMTRRLNLTLGAGYSSGESALRAASKFDTYTANVRSYFAVTRTLAVYLEYLYYYYDFGANALLAPNLPRRLERNGVRAGLSLSTLLLRK